MEDNLEMDFFNSDDLELNLESNYNYENEEEDQDDNSPENDVEDQTDQDNKENTNQGEDQEDSEKVAEEDDKEGDDNDSPNLFSSVATVLQEQGVLPSLDIENSSIETVDDLAKAVNNEVDTLVKTSLVEKLGQEGYDYLIKGVPLQVYDEYASNSQALNSITEQSLENDIELSKQIVLQDYINKGMSENKALKLIDRTSELGDDVLVEDAKESLENIKNYNKEFIESEKAKAVELQKQSEKQRLENEKLVKQSVYNTKELIEGQKFNKSVQDKVYKSITTIVGKSPEGVPENALMKARRENIVDFDTKLYYLFELTNGFKDFSKFSKGAKKSAINDLERAMKHNTTSLKGDNPSYLQDKDSYDSPYGDQLVL